LTLKYPSTSPPWRRSRGLEPREDLDLNRHHLLARLRNWGWYWVRRLCQPSTIWSDYQKRLWGATDLRSRRITNQPKVWIFKPERNQYECSRKCCFGWFHFYGAMLLLKRIVLELRQRLTIGLVSCSKFSEVFEVLDVHCKCVHWTVYVQS